MKNEVRFKKQWFNPLYFHLNKFIRDPNIRRVLVYGGKSSAKTFTICQLLAKEAYLHEASSILYRKEQNTIKTTIKQAIKKALSSIYFDGVVDIMDFKVQYTNGHEIVLKGLDEEYKVKGIEGFKYLLFDELDHFSEDEWLQANLSLRGLENQKLFATWNPIDENSWIKKQIDQIKWVDLPTELEDEPYSKLSEHASVQVSEDGKTVLIKTTYHDNKWIVGGDGYGFVDQNLIDEYEALAAIDYNKYNVNVLGKWGKRDVQRPYFHNFSHDKHTGDVRFMPQYQVLVIIDFNLNPFACIMANKWTDSNGDHLHFFHEIELHNGDLQTMATRIKETLPPIVLANALFSGDATGMSGNIGNKDAISNWQTLMRLLNISPQRLKLPRKNPSPAGMRGLLNLIMATHPDLVFSKNMKRTIFELAYTEADAEGNLIKSNRQKDEQKSDYLDCVRYCLQNFYGDWMKTGQRYLR